MRLWSFLYYSLIIRLDKLGQTFVVRLVISSIKTGTRRIMRLEEQTFVKRLERQTRYF